ncbi:DUF167 domain-containing protein [Piscinibacter terrae]|uniref:UPF0235 protein DZC73_19265 n=1 Tax=Piscinibacter terrae TaxID=2496871 RepID=A0A3N7HMQ2_9BURK|nr:DUF167 domain-containing protein [Albitalea terrae]RQP23430.1 YggU family protein [Albitalea terrae]
MTQDWPCLRGSDGAVVLDISVVPGAKRTELIGLHDGALRVRLAAPPVDGKANEALIAWIADELGVQRRDVELIRGMASRRKQVRVDVSLTDAQAWLARRMPAAT